MDKPSYTLVRLLADDGTWQGFSTDWKAQCEALNEEFENYAEATFSVVSDLIDTEHRKAGVFALHNGTQYDAMCQINRAPLPGYTSPVLRVRFITLSPEYDLTDKGVNEYGDVLVALLSEVLKLAYLDQELQSTHIKFHLRSPADQQFFRALGVHLESASVFEKIETKGAWLYIMRK